MQYLPSVLQFFCPERRVASIAKKEKKNKKKKLMHTRTL